MPHIFFEAFFQEHFSGIVFNASFYLFFFTAGAFSLVPYITEYLDRPLFVFSDMCKWFS
jgi:hypothetical protein